MTAIERARLLREAFARRIMVLDGAMGTMIQSLNLAAADFGGPQYEGCNEHLNLTRPRRSSTSTAPIWMRARPHLEQLLRVRPLCPGGI